MIKFFKTIGERSFVKNSSLRRTYKSSGLVGLPNVGKSTLFNAITETQRARAENYPFCTIEPNVGNVLIRDPLLSRLAEKANSRKLTFAQMKLHDIAGLVKDASKGKGLGNQFLEDIRRVSSITHVVRCFDDPLINHVEDGPIDPIRDIAIIENELLLADLDMVAKKLSNRKIKSDAHLYNVLVELEDILLDGNLNRLAPINTELSKFQLNLLCTKPVLYACNVSEDDVASGETPDLVKRVEKFVAEERPHSRSLMISAQIESELAQISNLEERQSILEAFDLSQSHVDSLVAELFTLLNLKTYYTVGEKETRSWLIRDGATAKEAAGAIHSDMQDKFIKAEVTPALDFFNCDCDDALARKRKKTSIEGKDYIVQQGDVMVFRFRN